MQSQPSEKASPRCPSPVVSSPQSGPHQDLNKVLERHRRAAYDKPVSDHTRAAFAWVREIIAQEPRPLLLDAGCGVGEASRELARRHPNSWVIGVDRSAHRLGKAGWAEPGLRAHNLLLARAELVDFWRLALADGWRLTRHYLLYPSPWPKPGHLMRRWHAHPVFQAVLGLGGRLELRTNWRIYAEEFCCAVDFFDRGPAAVEYFEPHQALTPFERKFAASGHPLFRVEVELGASNAGHNPGPHRDAN